MKDKLILITGSTSGIGLAIAKHLASLNASLIINGFADAKQVEHISSDLKSSGARDVFYYPVNLSIPAEIVQMFEEINNKFGRLDILINNAGIQFVSFIDEFPDDKWEEIIRVNLNSSFYTTKYSLPLMKRNNWGRIINIASAHGLVASPKKSAYVAAKHGLIGLTKSVALEVANHNITINAICPGYVKTPLLEKQIQDRVRADNVSEQEAIKSLLEGTHATNKFVEVQDIINIVMMLCNSSSINGSAVRVDHAWTSH